MLGKMEALNPRMLESLKWEEMRIQPLAVRVSAYFGYSRAASEKPPNAWRKTMCLWVRPAETSPYGRVKKPLIVPVARPRDAVDASQSAGRSKRYQAFFKPPETPRFLDFSEFWIHSNASYLK